MGLEWDPDGDSERRKETRKRLVLTAVIVLAILGYVGKVLYHNHKEAEREREIRILNDALREQRGY